jgi:hypothetical protein
MAEGLKAGDQVVRSRYWAGNCYDRPGRGEGIGTVVNPPHPRSPIQTALVRWPECDAYEPIDGLDLVLG